MLVLRNALAISVLMCCVALSRSVRVTSYIRNWNISTNVPKDLIQGTLFGTDNNNFPYATCKFSKPQVQRMCEVSFISPNRAERTCRNVNVFASEYRELFLKGYFQLWPFTQDHVALIWWDNTPAGIEPKEHNFHFKILNMADCSSSDVTLPIDKVAYGFFPALVLYPNEIHAIVNSKKSCKGAAHCRITYDLRGKRVGEVMPYQPDLSGYANPVSPQAFNKGFFQTVQDLEKVTVLLVNQAGVGQTILVDRFGEQANQNISFSSAYEYYGYCRLPNTGAAEGKKKIHCYQYDAKGKEIMNSTLEVTELVNSVAVRNLAGGGLLLMTAGCDKPKTSNELCEKFHVYKINKNGRPSKSVDIRGPGFSCYKTSNPSSDHPDVRISENKDELCFDFSCLYSDKNLAFASKCANKNYFLKALN